MPKWNQIIATMCVVAMLPVQGMAELERQAQPGIRELVEVFGTGSELKLSCADGRRLRGRVTEIRSEGIEFLVRGRSEAPVTLQYDDILALTLARRVYRSDDGRDTLLARRVATALGRGHHVLARVQSGRTYRGHINAVRPDGLTLVLDRSDRAVSISYGEIDHLEENLSRAAKIGIIAAVAGGVVGIVLLAIYVKLSENE